MAEKGEEEEESRRHAHVVRADGTGGRYPHQLIAVLLCQAAEATVLITDDQTASAILAHERLVQSDLVV